MDTPYTKPAILGAYLYDRSGQTMSDTVFTPIKGYAFVETANPQRLERKDDAPYLRYTLKDASRPNGEREKQAIAVPVHELKSRYAISWEDISTAEDRKYWVAGSTLSVFDLRTNELVA